VRGSPGRWTEGAVDSQRRRGSVLIEASLQMLHLGSAGTFPHDLVACRPVLYSSLYRDAPRRVGRVCCRRSDDSVEEINRGFARHHARSDLVGVSLMNVADLADATRDGDSCSLLHDVRGGE
jgi:hypothetical protein